MSSRGRRISRPIIDERFLYGEIVDWSFKNTIIKVKNTYGYRYTLTFANGIRKEQQKSGFKTKKEAEDAKNEAIYNIGQNKFIPFEYSVKSFFDFWLYGIMANTHNIIALNPALSAIHIHQKEVKRGKIQLTEGQSTSIILNADQISYILYQAKDKYFDSLFFPLLLATTTSLRIGEAVAVRYEDIDFYNKELHISRQLGRSMDEAGLDSDKLCVQERDWISSYEISRFTKIILHISCNRK